MSGPVQYGVTPAGFVLKPVQQLLTEYTQDLLALIDPTTDVSPDQPLGQALGIGAKKLGEVWQLGQTAYNNTNRGAVEGDQLDNVGLISGTIREGNSPSSVQALCQFTAPGTYIAGALVAFPAASPASQFANVYPIVVPAIGGNGVDPIGIGNAWPSTDDTKPSYGTTFLFQSLAEGPTSGDALVAAEAVSSPALTSMVPFAGWLNIIETGSVTVGALVELDPPYRVRQQQDLSAPGNDTIDATAAAVLEALQNAPTPIVGASVEIYENTTLAVDGNGLPPKSYLVVVFAGASPDKTQTNPLIAQAIWDNHPGGGTSTGSTSFAVADSQGVQRIVSWTYATAISVQLEITLYVNLALLNNPTAKAALQASTATAIVNASQGQPFTMYGNTISPGEGSLTTLVPGADVVAEAFRSIAQGQPGVIDAQPTVPTSIITSPTPNVEGNVTVGVGSYGSLLPPTIAVALFVP